MKTVEPYDHPDVQSAQPVEGRPVVQTNYGPLDRDAVMGGRVAGVGTVSVQYDPQSAGPTLTSLEPETIAIGSPSTTLRVLGTRFTPASIITFAGQRESTTFVSATEVTTGLDMDVWKGADTVPVSVDGSAPLMFTFTAASRRR